MTERRQATVLAVVQARMSSRRLPGKVLREIEGRPVLAMVLDRLGRCAQLDEIVLATSIDATDDPIAEFANERGQPLHRGPLGDVLARFLGAIESSEAMAVVRVTADSPLIDPTLVDRLVDCWRTSDAAYVSSMIEPPSFPIGLGAEVISREALLLAGGEANDPADREHVTTWIRARPERFRAQGLWMIPPIPAARVTLDTPKDLEHLRRLVSTVGADPELGEMSAALGGGPDPKISGRPPEAH